MNDDYIINIISSIGDVKREFRLDDILRHNSPVQPLHYSGVRHEYISIPQMLKIFHFQPTVALDTWLLTELVVTSVLIICLSFTLTLLIMSQTL